MQYGSHVTQSCDCGLLQIHIKVYVQSHTKHAIMLSSAIKESDKIFQIALAWIKIEHRLLPTAQHLVVKSCS